MFSNADLSKQTEAKELSRQCAGSGTLVLSTQVVQEFLVAGLRQLSLPGEQLQEATSALLELPLVVIGPPQILSAIRDVERYRISFWDALILAAAQSCGAEGLYTEDLNDGQRYGSVVARNPFQLTAN